MARNPVQGGTLLVELKAVDAGYPLYGRLDTQPARPLDQLLAGGGVVVEQAVLERLRLAPGDLLAIGDSTFTVTGVVRKEPDRAASLFTLGPRVLLNAASLDATGLVRHGSRVRHRTLLRLPAELEPRAARAALVQAMADPAVRVATFDEAQPGLRRFFDQLTAYLRLVGVTSLLVGGIGVAAAVRAFLARKVATIAILRCLGATARTLTAVYVAQALVLGALGSLAGAALGTAAQLLLGPLLQPFVPFELEARAAPGAVATGLLAGCLATLLFALWPLLSARAVPPAILLRHPVDAGSVRPRRPWATAGVVAGGLAAARALASGPAQGRRHLPRGRRRSARAPRPGRVGHAAARRAAAPPAVPRLAPGTRRLDPARQPDGGGDGGPRHRRDAPHRGGAPRAGAHAPARPRAAPRGALLLLRRRPAGPGRRLPPDHPDVPGAAPPALVPVVRARLVAINGAPIARERWAGREDAWRVTREYVLTFAAEPPAGTVITRGRWWAGDERGARVDLRRGGGGPRARRRPRRDPHLRRPGGAGGGRGAEPPQGGLADARRELLRDLLARAARRGAARLPGDGPGAAGRRTAPSRSAWRRPSPT